MSSGLPNTTEDNAREMVRLFKQMRGTRPGPGLGRLRDLNLGFSHMRALDSLAPDRCRSMKELAEELEITPPSLTMLARRLVQTGLVRRTPHPNDSRVALLALTEQGHALHEQLHNEHMARMTHLLQGLTPAEQRQFLDLLQRAVDTLSKDEQQRDPAADPPVVQL